VTAVAPASGSDRRFHVFNTIVSVAALGFLAWLLLLRESSSVSADLSFMPAVNAGLNATAACLLTAGWIAIRRRKRRLHQYLMVSAFGCSAVFLVGYVLYHYAAGDTPYTGVGPIRYVYFSVLITHVLLSMAVVPMSLAAFWFAARKRFVTHRKVTRILVPIWLYVSVTGVVIFFMLRTASGG
jgi:putative membrane protein